MNGGEILMSSNDNFFLELANLLEKHSVEIQPFIDRCHERCDDEPYILFTNNKNKMAECPDIRDRAMSNECDCRLPWNHKKIRELDWGG